jgi:hypothetical protein
MNAIKSLYIHKVEKHINAEFIAHVFDKNGIAKVSRILLEPRKNDSRYNRAFIEIKEWCDSEVAFNFIMRLRDPIREARFVYNQDEWWIVEINRYPHTISTKCENYRVITVFSDIYSNIEDDDAISTTAVISSQSDSINYEKTRQLKALIYGFKNVDEMDEAEEFDGYLHEAINEINEWHDDFAERFNNTLAF